MLFIGFFYMYLNRKLILLIIFLLIQNNNTYSMFQDNNIAINSDDILQKNYLDTNHEIFNNETNNLNTLENNILKILDGDDYFNQHVSDKFFNDTSDINIEQTTFNNNSDYNQNNIMNILQQMNMTFDEKLQNINNYIKNKFFECNQKLNYLIDTQVKTQQLQYYAQTTKDHIISQLISIIQLQTYKIQNIEQQLSTVKNK